jgi:hypothetical protein
MVQPDTTKRTVIFTVQEAAEIVGIPPGLLRLWLETDKFQTAVSARSIELQTTTYYFSEKDITKLIEFAAQQGKSKPAEKEDPFVDDGKQENFTVSQIASLWHLSTDTIQRLFQDEPGVVALGSKHPRGKRRRVTLRIPRAVMDRVKKRRSNPA